MSCRVAPVECGGRDELAHRCRSSRPSVRRAPATPRRSRRTSSARAAATPAASCSANLYSPNSGVKKPPTHPAWAYPGSPPGASITPSRETNSVTISSRIVARLLWSDGPSGRVRRSRLSHPPGLIAPPGRAVFTLPGHFGRSGLYCGGVWGKVGRRGPCYSANTSTPSMTRTASRCRPGSATAIAEASCSRAGSTPASRPTRAHDWEALVEAAPRRPRPAQPGDPQICERFYYSGAVEAQPDKQGRVMMPPALARARGARPRGRRRRHARPTSRSGIAPPGARSSKEVKGSAEHVAERLAAQARLTTSPFSPTRCARCSRSSPGETLVDGTFGAGGHASLLARDLQGNGQGDRDRPRPDRAPVLRALPPRQPACPRASCAATSRSSSTQLAENGVRGRRDPARPRRLEHAARPARARLLVRGRRAARHAHGSLRGATRPRELVNEASERELERIFRRYGEERFARQIARAIGRRRRKEPFERTGELVETIKAAIPAPARFGEGHPAKRVFQALRIAVNDELDALEDALPAAVEMLRPGGRLAVISFHSLEDRIVKHFFREEARGCTCPPDFPVCVCGHEPVLRVLTRAAGAAERPRGGAEPARPRRRGCASRRRSSSGCRSQRSPSGRHAPERPAETPARPGRAPRVRAAPASARRTAPAHRRRRRLDRRHRRRCSPASSP